MIKLDPEEEEFWEDYHDPVIDEFLSAQSHYNRTLRAQAAAAPASKRTAKFPTPHTPADTNQMASADRDVYNARVRYETAIEMLQSMSVEECRKIIAQINLIQEEDPDCEMNISGMVRHLAVGRNVWHSRNVQKQTPWYRILPSHGPSTFLEGHQASLGYGRTTQ